MTTAIEFLQGKAAPGGLTVSWVLNATDKELDNRHDWIQWAFPNTEPSRFNALAPVVTAEGMASLDQEAILNLKRMYDRFMRFLVDTDHWRTPGDHNHLRITRTILCLRLSGWNTLASELYDIASRHGNPSLTTQRIWQDALTKTL